MGADVGLEEKPQIEETKEPPLKLFRPTFFQRGNLDALVVPYRDPSQGVLLVSRDNSLQGQRWKIERKTDTFANQYFEEEENWLKRKLLTITNAGGYFQYPSDTKGAEELSDITVTASIQDVHNRWTFVPLEKNPRFNFGTAEEAHIESKGGKHYMIVGERRLELPPEGELIDLGRGDDPNNKNKIVIPSQFTSANHATLFILEGKVFIHDHSRVGTRIKIPPKPSF